MFTDHERLAGEANDLWDWLAQHRPGARLLNDPRRVRSRHDLLDLLHGEGINRYRAHRVDAPRDAIRLPAFVRPAHEHDGNLTEPLEDRAALDRAVEELLRKGRHRDELLIVEWCDTSDADGVFRKYAAFCVDGRIVPRQLFFGREWMVKRPGLVDPQHLAEERAYVAENPHEAELARLFRLAQVDYGRIDYAMLDGRPQVWEINTNPVVMAHRAPRFYKEPRRGVQVGFAARLCERLWELERTVPAAPVLDRWRLRFLFPGAR